jgi:oligoribonuclease (3'-5' exoribonuclease)
MTGFTDYESKTREELERMLEARQKSYIERERVWKIRINELEEELAAQREEKTGWMRSDTRMKGLKNMQSKILENVELVQDRTARILQEQERDLLRAFRARLFDVQAELEKEKNKKDDGAAAWIERSRKLEAEVEWAKEVADRLERVNQTLLQENNRLKSQFSSQEEDRNFLIKQLVSVKKDNARLRAEYTELENVHELLKQENNQLTEKLAAHQTAAMPSTGKMSSGNGGLGALVGVGKEKDHAALQQRLDSEERYKELNGRLRRLLTEERKALASTRSKYEAEMAIRTDMEMLLRHCVEDVRKEIAHRYAEEGHFTSNTGNDLAKLYSKQPGLIPIDDFTQGDRERVLELLLSQERVVSLIYAKTFPIHNPGTAKSQNNDFNASSANGGGGALGSNQQLDMSSTFNELGGDTFPSPTAADMRPSTTNMAAGGIAGTKLPSINTGGAFRGASR